MIAMFSGEDYEITKAFLKAALDSYDEDVRKTNILALPIVTGLLMLRRDQEAYDILKYSAFKHQMVDIPKNQNRSENIMDVLNTIEACPLKKCGSDCRFSKIGIEMYCWIAFAIIKINLIEEMKNRLAKLSNDIIPSCSQNFKDRHRLVDGLGCFFLGNF